MIIIFVLTFFRGEAAEARLYRKLPPSPFNNKHRCYCAIKLYNIMDATKRTTLTLHKQDVRLGHLFKLKFYSYTEYDVEFSTHKNVYKHTCCSRTAHKPIGGHEAIYTARAH